MYNLVYIKIFVLWFRKFKNIGDTYISMNQKRKLAKYNCNAVYNRSDQLSDFEMF